MCFADLEKAFDSVPRGVLWGVFRDYGVSGPLIQAVSLLYAGVRVWSASPAVSWTRFGEGWAPGLPFITDSFHNFYGQNF